MVPAEDDRSPPEESPEFAALRETAEEFRRDNARLRLQLAELLQQSPNDPDLMPLGLLVAAGAEYEAARRAIKNKTLRAVVLGKGKRKGRLSSKQEWVDMWRSITSRRR
jgi:hypothetical protein